MSGPADPDDDDLNDHPDRRDRRDVDDQTDQRRDAGEVARQAIERAAARDPNWPRVEPVSERVELVPGGLLWAHVTDNGDGTASVSARGWIGRSPDESDELYRRRQVTENRLVAMCHAFAWERASRAFADRVAVQTRGELRERIWELEADIDRRRVHDAGDVDARRQGRRDQAGHDRTDYLTRAQERFNFLMSCLLTLLNFDAIPAHYHTLFETYWDFNDDPLPLPNAHDAPVLRQAFQRVPDLLDVDLTKMPLFKEHHGSRLRFARDRDVQRDMRVQLLAAWQRFQRR